MPQGGVEVSVENRRNKRYYSAGEAELWNASLRATGDLLDVSIEGALIGSGFNPSRGLELATRIKVQDYEGVVVGKGMVMRTLMDTVAIKFMEEPTGMRNLLHWLEKQEKGEVVKTNRPI